MDRPVIPIRQQGLYSPGHEHDTCGVGFIVHLKGQKSHKIIEDGLTALEHLNHRGACGCEVEHGRRRRRADPDPARLLRARLRARRHPPAGGRPLRRRALLRRRRTSGRRSRRWRSSASSSRRRASTCSAGVRCRRTTPTLGAHAHSPRARHVPRVHRPRRRLARRR